jgi:hypothetical protein
MSKQYFEWVRLDITSSKTGKKTSKYGWFTFIKSFGSCWRTFDLKRSGNRSKIEPTAFFSTNSLGQTRNALI